ncbi:MAG: LysE family translocator [Rhodobacteraceae bacterium]|nr:LysE family translocator [Paracoccaceae bacterium]
MDLHTWLAFVAASSLLLVVPGPTILLVLSYALSQGRKVALAVASGVALGDLVAMTASLAGLGALLAASAAAFAVVKFAGAAYLVWLGLTMLRKARHADPALPVAPAGDRPARMFGHAAAVTALNPKSIGFFLAFVPQFILPTQPILPQAALLVATFVSLAALNALAYALLADRLRTRLARPAAIRALTRAGGVTLIAMGALTAAARRTAA